MEQSEIVYHIWKSFIHKFKRSHVCSNSLPFFEPKLEDFLSFNRHEMLPKCFAKIGGLIIPYYKWSFAQMFCLFWSQNWRNFSLVTHEVFSKLLFVFFGAKTGVLSISYGLHIHLYNLALFFLFLEPKFEDLKLF